MYASNVCVWTLGEYVHAFKCSHRSTPLSGSGSPFSLHTPAGVFSDSQWLFLPPIYPLTFRRKKEDRNHNVIHKPLSFTNGSRTFGSNARLFNTTKVFFPVWKMNVSLTQRIVTEPFWETIICFEICSKCTELRHHSLSFCRPSQHASLNRIKKCLI